MTTQVIQQTIQSKPRYKIPTFKLSDNNAIYNRSNMGWLLKWRIKTQNNKHLWIKAPGYLTDWGGESYAEVLASAMCMDLGIKNFVRYSPCVVIYNGVRLLSCYSFDFCEKNHEKLITCLDVLNFNNVETNYLNINDYEGMLQYIKRFTGLKMRHHFEDMLFLDFMIYNFDRGLRNFGFLVNKQCRYREAPIFDSGNSFGLPTFECGVFDREYININGGVARPFYNTFEEQLKLIRSNRVYRTDFKYTKNVLKWFMWNSSEIHNRLCVENYMLENCFIYITSMLEQNYLYYKRLFNIQ